jgi:hypothetical protein
MKTKPNKSEAIVSQHGEHTPTPWNKAVDQYGRSRIISVKTDKEILMTPENAAFLVRAVNEYHGLKAENQRLKEENKALYKLDEEGRQDTAYWKNESNRLKYAHEGLIEVLRTTVMALEDAELLSATSKQSFISRAKEVIAKEGK